MTYWLSVNVLNGRAMFYETFICFYVSEAKPPCFSLNSQMFDDVERCYINSKISSYLFVISFQLMFYKTLRYRLARALRNLWVTSNEIDSFESEKSGEVEKQF